MIRVTKRFNGPTGPQVLHFDYSPAEPTADQIRATLPHTCETCEWKNLRHTSYCGNPTLQRGKPCTRWAIHWDYIAEGERRYYENLHRQCYG